MAYQTSEAAYVSTNQIFIVAYDNKRVWLNLQIFQAFVMPEDIENVSEKSRLK